LQKKIRLHLFYDGLFRSVNDYNYKSQNQKNIELGTKINPDIYAMIRKVPKEELKGDC